MAISHIRRVIVVTRAFGIAFGLCAIAYFASGLYFGGWVTRKTNTGYTIGNHGTYYPVSECGYRLSNGIKYAMIAMLAGTFIGLIAEQALRVAAKKRK